MAIGLCIKFFCTKRIITHGQITLRLNQINQVICIENSILIKDLHGDRKPILKNCSDLSQIKIIIYK